MEKRRRNRRKRILLQAVALCLAVLCLGSCVAGGGKPSDTTGAPATPMAEMLADYTIIYPDNGTTGEGAAADLLFKAFDSDLSKLPQSDWVKTGDAIPSGNHEILIGQTNRASSQAAVSKLERERDWSISVNEGEIVIAAKNDAAIVEATEYFISIVLPASNSLYTPGFHYGHQFTYQLDAFYGIDRGSVTIAYAEECLTDAAALLQDYLLANMGVRVDAVETGGNVQFIIDDSMDADTYDVRVINSVLKVKGGSYIAVEEAVKTIVTEDRGASVEAFTGNSSIPATITDLRNREMNLVWHDEFDGDTLNSKYWQLYDRMFGGSTIVSTTTEKNIKVEDGKVIMRSWKEGTNADGTNKYSTHTTLTSTGKISFLYGYIEISAKFEFKPSCFPSFWFQSAPEHRTQDYMTEIDMFEPYYFGYMESGIHMWYLREHSSGFGGAYADYWCEPARYTLEGFEDFWYYWNYKEAPALSAEQQAAIDDWNSKFHTFGFGWTPTELYYTIDGVEVGRHDISETSTLKWNLSNTSGDNQDQDWLDFVASGEQAHTEGFRQDALFINFTNWIGGSFRYPAYGVPDEDSFPNTFEVDWIRLYQMEGEGVLNYDYK